MRRDERRREQRRHVASHHRRATRRIGELRDAVLTPTRISREQHPPNAAIRCIHLDATPIAVAHVPPQNRTRRRGCSNARDVVAEIHAVQIRRHIHRGARPREPQLGVAHRLRLHPREVAVVGHVSAVQVIIAGKEIVARRFAARDAVRRVRGKTRGQLVRDAGLRIEEHPVDAARVDAGVGIGLVAERRVAPLQVGKPAGLSGVERQLGKGAGVLLVAGVVVQRGGGLEVAAMRALVCVGVNAGIHAQRAALHVVCARHAIPRMRQIEAIAIGQRDIVVVAARRVAVHRGACRPAVLQGARIRQRHHLLSEFVALVGLQRIVATIRPQLVERRTGVRERVGQQPHQRGQLDHIARAEPPGAHEGRAAQHPTVIAVPVGAQRTGPAVHREFAVGEPRVERRAHALRAERSHLQLHVTTGIGTRHRHRFEIHTASERRRASRARAHTALHLHRLHVRHQVGQIGEVQHLIFHVVQRHAVERDVDARLVDAAQPQVAVAPAGAGFGVRRHGGRRIHEQHRDVLPEVPLRDSGATDGGLRDRRLFVSTDSADQHAFDTAHGVGLGRDLGAVGAGLRAERGSGNSQEGGAERSAEGSDTKSRRAPWARDCVRIHRLDSLRRYEPDQVLRDSLSQRALAAPAPRSCAENFN